MLDRASLQRGMIVRDAAGERVGTVLTLGDRQFVIRHGLFRSHYLVDYHAIREIRGGVIHLGVARGALPVGRLGFADREPVSTIKPLASEQQLHVQGLPMDRWYQATDIEQV